MGVTYILCVVLCMKTSNKGSNDKHNFVASLTLVNCFICDAMCNKTVYLLCPISAINVVISMHNLV